MVPLYKDDDVVVTGYYRGISLECCVAKVFTRLLVWRLGFCEENVFTEALGDFTSKRCADQLFVFKGVL